MTAPTAQPATPELLALVAAARPDLDVDEIQDLIADAEMRGWTWPQCGMHTVRMALCGDEPRDLRAALRVSPTGRASPRTPGGP